MKQPTDKNAGKKLAQEHWNSYIRSLIKTHENSPERLKLAKFHYVSAFTHGYKHGQEAKDEISD